MRNAKCKMQNAELFFTFYFGGFSLRGLKGKVEN